MSNHPEVEGAHVVVRRRRTRRHSRNRFLRRALLIVVCALVTLGFSSVALQYLTPSLFRSSRNSEPSRESAEASRDLLVATQRAALRDMEIRKVYPYSIVPGGVKDAQELKWAAQHDPVVARHYAGFDYDRARIVRLTLARTVYVSYRIGNKIYWTRHRISLKKGETVLTDGKITARTRCANRVEEVPQQATSSSEPPAAKFEEPINPLAGTAVTVPPVPFQSTLLQRPASGLGPAPPLSLYDPFQNGIGVPVFLPALPDVCGLGTKKKGSSGTGGGISIVTGKGKKKVTNPCGPGGLTEVPEPGTWLLMISGLAAICWKARQRFARA